jgi:hypothetical protein
MDFQSNCWASLQILGQRFALPETIAALATLHVRLNPARRHVAWTHWAFALAALYFGAASRGRRIHSRAPPVILYGESRMKYTGA